MRTGVVAAATVLLLAALAGARPACAEDAFRIGVMVDGPWLGNPGVLELTVAEIQALTEGEFEVEFPESGFLVGEWNLESAYANLDRLLNDPGIDLVITWGLLSSHAVCCYLELPKPVIAPVVVDIELQGVPYRDGVSGVGNLSYVALPYTLSRELALFRRVVPFRKVSIMANSSFLEAVPEIVTRTNLALTGSDYEFEYVGVEDSAADALADLADDTEAVYVWPQFQLPPEEFARLVQGLNERRLPSFSALGRDGVEAGMLASAVSSDFFPRMARRIALNVQRILLGEPPGEIPVAFAIRDELVINMSTARAIGVSPPWEILNEAKQLIDDEEAGIERRSLAGVVQEAVAANLDLLAGERVVAAGQQDVARADSAYYPQLGASALGLVVDEDRAAASFGSQPERSLTASGALSQLLYAEDALANKRIQRQLQRARIFDLQALRLDIARDAAVTYLNLLRAKSLVNVQRNNLELTRSNLELAEIRRSIGAANPAEVYRWESQIATDQKNLVEAVADQRIAELAVNRLLNRPLDQRFATEEVGLEDPGLITGEERFEGYTDTPLTFSVFQDFIVEEGLANSPELKAVEAGILAQKRLLTATKRAYWAPNIAAEAGLDERLTAEGAGTEGAPGIPTPDDTSWSVALSFSLPLLTGGARKADRVQASEELAQLEADYDGLAQRIEQSIRSGMEQTRASFSGIQLSDQAAAAARRNLELVSDAYARGAVSIIDLLDAQNAALNAEELAANAVYDFFIDLMEVQRAANRLDFFVSPESRDAWYERLELFFAAAGVEPFRPE